MRHRAAWIGSALMTLAFGACGASNSADSPTTTTAVATSTSTTPPTTVAFTAATSTTPPSSAPATTTGQVTIEGEDAYLAARLVDVPGYGYLDLPDDLRKQLEIEMEQTVLEAQAEEQVGINPIERVSGHMVTMSGTAIGFLMLVELNDQWKALAGSMIGTFLENFGAGPDGESSLVDIAGTNVMVTTTADEVDYAWFNDGVVHLVVGDPSASTTSFVEGFINATAASGVATTTTFG